MMFDRRGLLRGALGLTGAFVADSAVRGDALNVKQFGARGDGITKDTGAIQKAIDECGRRGGGRVVVPAGGVYLSGNLQLRPHVQFFLEGGATLKVSGDREDFRDFGALLFAKDAPNVEVTGTGMIDGNFPAYLTEMQEGGFEVTFPFLGPYDPLYSPAEQHHEQGRPRMILLMGK